MNSDSLNTDALSGKVALGSDHAGLDLKESIKNILNQIGIVWEDFGTYSKDSCDYPDYARKVAEAVSQGECYRGILCCGSGIGVSIVANKVRNIRAALCNDVQAAVLSRQHNNANVLCLGARLLEPEVPPEIIKAWLSTQFEGGRHQSRLDKIEVQRKSDT